MSNNMSSSRHHGFYNLSLHKILTWINYLAPHSISKNKRIVEVNETGFSKSGQIALQYECGFPYKQSTVINF